MEEQTRFLITWLGTFLKWICTIFDFAWESWVRFSAAFFFFFSSQSGSDHRNAWAGKYCLPGQLGLKGLKGTFNVIGKTQVCKARAFERDLSRRWWGKLLLLGFASNPKGDLGGGGELSTWWGDHGGLSGASRLLLEFCFSVHPPEWEAPPGAACVKGVLATSGFVFFCPSCRGHQLKSSLHLDLCFSVHSAEGIS